MKITPEVRQHLLANMNLNKRQLMLANFLGGLSWGFGTVIGATVVVAILGALLQTLGFFDTFNSIIHYSQAMTPKK